MGEIYLPTGGSVPVGKTAKERKALEREAAYMNTCPPRREVLALVQNALNDLGNSIIYYILSHFDLTPKTDEGRRLLEAVAAAEKAQEGLEKAEVSQVTTAEAREEATAITEGR